MANGRPIGRAETEAPRAPAALAEASSVARTSAIAPSDATSVPYFRYNMAHTNSLVVGRLPKAPSEDTLGRAFRARKPTLNY